MHDTSWEQPPERSNGFLIRLWRLTQLALHVLTGLIKAALLLPWVNRTRRTGMIHLWAIRLLDILHVRLSVKGLRPDVSTTNVMFIANHVSWLDIYLLMAVCPARFVSKSEVRTWPVIGWLTAQVGTLFIERARRHDTARSSREVVDALNQGDNVAVFPEGTTSDGTLLLPFHASLLQSVINSQAQLWPVALRYVHRDGTVNVAPAYAGDMSLLDSLRSILAEPEIMAEMTYLEPLPIQGRSRRELAALAEMAIANALNLPVPCRKSGKSADLPAALP